MSMRQYQVDDVCAGHQYTSGHHAGGVDQDVHVQVHHDTDAQQRDARHHQEQGMGTTVATIRGDEAGAGQHGCAADEDPFERVAGQEFQPDQRQQRQHERQQRAMHRAQHRGGGADAVDQRREAPRRWRRWDERGGRLEGRHVHLLEVLVAGTHRMVMRIAEPEPMIRRGVQYYNVSALMSGARSMDDGRLFRNPCSGPGTARAAGRTAARPRRFRTRRAVRRRDPAR